jgi:hypothetical protein
LRLSTRSASASAARHSLSASGHLVLGPGRLGDDRLRSGSSFSQASRRMMHSAVPFGFVKVGQ